MYRVGRRVKVSGVLIASILLAQAVPSFATEIHQFDIPAKPAIEAVNDFASQAHVQILVDANNVKGKQLRPVFGEYSTDAGLKLLLTDSGLKPQYIGDHSVALVTGGNLSAPMEAAEGKGEDPNEDSQRPQGEQRQSLWERFRVAQAGQTVPTEATSVAKENKEQALQKEPVALQEVVVTAQKRNERLLDVPVPVAVVDAGQLTDTGQVLLRDYYSSVPGLSAQPGINGSQALSIRGITTGADTSPTVGVTIDDVPFGASGGRSDGNFVPDIDPGDLAHIEVLRGPQGTLYGAGSMGGLIKYVTSNPTTSGFSGRIEGGYASVYNGAEPGFNVRASFNVPLSNTLAIRVSGFVRQDPGYIDNPTLDLKGVNEAQANGARLSALWTPSEELSVKVSALYQTYKANGLSEVDQAPGLGPLQHNYINGLGPTERTVQGYSANINYQLGPVLLTSVTGYSEYRLRAPFDFTPFFGQYTAGGVQGTSFKGFGVTGTGLFSFVDQKKTTQELRASGSFGKVVDWIVGGFYDHEYDGNVQVAEGINNTTGAQLGQLSYSHYPDIYQEYAGFVNLTFHLTDRLDVQVGGRESHNRTEEDSYGVGPEGLLIFGSDPFSPANEYESGNSFTYLASPSYKVTSNIFLYTRFASGYQPGAPNANVPGVPALKPSKTTNYEVGAKGSFLNDRLTLDASLFYIDWNDIQLNLLTANKVSYDYNGSGAKSEGIEFSAEARPIRGMSLSGWITYDDAVLTQAFPAGSTAYGVPGNRLPFTPHFSAYGTVEQQFPLWTDTVGFAGGTVSYIGSRVGPFQATPQVQNFPAYTKIDLRTGVKFDSWTASLYANNVTNKRGLLNGGLGYVEPNALIYITPRVIGLTLSREF